MRAVGIFLCWLCLIKGAFSAPFVHSSAPQGATELTELNPIYGVVLSKYFNAQYQAALKELSLIKTESFSREALKQHQHFEKILKVNNGQHSGDVVKFKVDDTASIQALFLATQSSINDKNYEQAKSLLSLVPRHIPNTLKNQHAWILSQMALYLSSQKDYLKTSALVDNTSEEYAQLLQQQSVKFVKPLDEVLQKITALTDGHVNQKNAALTALGYRYLEDNNAEGAINAFSKISLNGLLSNSGMLGFGLALNQIGKYEQSQIIFNRILKSNDPSIIAYQAALANALALEKQGNETQAFSKLTSMINKASIRLDNLSLIEQKIAEQSECIINLLNHAVTHTCDFYGEELNEQLLMLLSTKDFLKVNKQYQSVAQLEFQYNQQLETISSFVYLLEHQVTQISQLLNKQAMIDLADRITDITAKKKAVVISVDEAEEARNGHFFLSSHYLELQDRVDKVFKNMVFLKRAGQKNTASERRVTLMQRIIWWHSYSNFSDNIANTRDNIEQLNNQIIADNNAYKVLEDFLAKVPTMKKQLKIASQINDKILIEQPKLAVIKKQLNQQVKSKLKQFFDAQYHSLQRIVVDAELARVRIEDASFNRALLKEEGLKQ